MKRLILTCIALLGFTALASAQETFSVLVGGATTNRSTYLGQIQLGRLQANADVCSRAQLPATCTQAQACTALLVPGGAACTAAQANAANARIYADTLAGREAFVTIEMVRLGAGAFLAEQLRREQNTFGIWCRAATQVQKDVICTAAGLVAGCNPCP